MKRKIVRREASGVRRLRRANLSHLTPHASRLTASRRGRLILVIGGAASGKSDVALAMAGKAAPRAFVATGEALDDEMAERIALHQQSRDRDWHLAEVPMDLAGWFEKEGPAYRTIVLDCLTLWLSNLQGAGIPAQRTSALVAGLLCAMKEAKARILVVTNELGLGLVPAEAGSRRFRDLAGKVNRQFAQAVDEVYFVVSGLPVRIK